MTSLFFRKQGRALFCGCCGERNKRVFRDLEMDPSDREVLCLRLDLDFKVSRDYSLGYILVSSAEPCFFEGPFCMLVFFHFLSVKVGFSSKKKKIKATEHQKLLKIGLEKVPKKRTTQKKQ